MPADRTDGALGPDNSGDGIGCAPPDFIPDGLERKVIRLDKGQVLFHLADPVLSLYYVLSGAIEALRHSPDGEALIMMRASAGDFFGEPALGLEEYTCEARASDESRLLAFSREAFLGNLTADPEFASAFLLLQVRNRRRECSRLERVRLKRAEDRVLHFLVCETLWWSSRRPP